MPGRTVPPKEPPGAAVEEGKALEPPAQPAANPRAWIAVVGFGGGYIALSSGLISFNKYLIHEGRFPYASVIVLMHMIGSTVFASCLRLICPSLFPSLTDPAKRVNVGVGLMCKNIIPIASLFAFQLVLSNTAYLHSTVAFLQMLKEANIVLVYLLSLAVMLETFKMRNLMILVGIVAATSLCIHGEMNFSWTGFALQGTSQFAESAKIVLQALVLSGNSKLDPMSYVLLVAPCCAVSLLAIGAGQFMFMPDMHLANVAASMVDWAPYLVANTLVAFSLNVVIAFYIKHTSGIAFILAGVAKDVMIVLAGAAFFHEHISVMQFLGFSMQIGGVFLWSLVKTFPKNFEEGVVKGVMLSLNPYPPPVEKKAAYGATQA